MLTKSVIVPELRRTLAPPFAWVERRFLFDGFLSRLTYKENLLYFFLVLAADRDGVSFYSYDKICRLLQLSCDDYIAARDGLIAKRLVAFDGHQFQVLALPERPQCPQPKPKRGSEPVRGPAPDGSEQDAQNLAEIFARLARS